jgi:hypothetical protein
MKAVEILRLVSGALQDLEPGNPKRWEWKEGDDSGSGLLDFLNDALLAVALQRPDATAVTDTVLLAPGMRQKIPKDALTLVEVIRNMGGNGECPGPAIMPANPDILLSWGRICHCSCVIDNFAYDRSTNPAFYYVYPSVPESGDVFVEITYSAKPKHISNPDDDLPIVDSYAPAIKHHMLASIMSGDSESSNMTKAQYHMQMFQTVLGVKSQIDAVWPKASVSLRGGTDK